MKWVNQICSILETIGFKVYSPSRENGVINNSTSFEERKAIFKDDISLLIKSDIVIALLDHDDPGTCFEIGYAFSMCKPIIGLKTSPFNLNNMILYGCNSICESIDHLISEVCSVC